VGIACLTFPNRQLTLSAHKFFEPPAVPDLSISQNVATTFKGILSAFELDA
jgi:hypothetical protein